VIEGNTDTDRQVTILRKTEAWTRKEVKFTSLNALLGHLSGSLEKACCNHI
jgi:hypothetical protein